MEIISVQQAEEILFSQVKSLGTEEKIRLSAQKPAKSWE